MLEISVKKLAGADEEAEESAKYENVGKALAEMWDALQSGNAAKAGEAFCLACELERGY